MSRRSRQKARLGGAKASIDMNSLIDLTFLLLVTFMITLPAITNGVDLDLPESSEESQSDKEDESLEISIQKDSRIYLKKGGEEVPLNDATKYDDMAREVKNRLMLDPTTLVRVRADTNLNYGVVMKTMDVLQRCNARKVSLVTKTY